MKVKELMIGDIVSYNGTICRVTSIECFGNLVGIENDTICELVSEDELSPIHLSKEVFEKNGFHKGSYVGGYLHRDFLFRVYPVGSEFPITSFVYEESPIDETVFYCHYVHELQYALRLCGLNELADNFKV